MWWVSCDPLAIWSWLTEHALHVPTVSTNQQARAGSCVPCSMHTFFLKCVTTDQNVGCSYIWSDISVALSASFPVLFWLLCVTQGLHQTKKTADRGREKDKERKRKKKDRDGEGEWKFGKRREMKDRIQYWCHVFLTQAGKVSNRNSFVNSCESDFPRPHGLHLAMATLPPFICRVIRALSDHVL